MLLLLSMPRSSLRLPRVWVRQARGPCPAAARCTLSSPLLQLAPARAPPPPPPPPAVSIYATGQVLHYTHDWSLVFEVAAGLYAVGAAAYLKWASCEEQFAHADGGAARQLAKAKVQ